MPSSMDTYRLREEKLREMKNQETRFQGKEPLPYEKSISLVSFVMWIRGSFSWYIAFWKKIMKYFNYMNFIEIFH